MRLQTAQAIYADGRLIFSDPEQAPRSGTEVVVTYVAQSGESPIADVIKALRGRGKGEELVEKLLRSRSEDRDHDERVNDRLRT